MARNRDLTDESPSRHDSALSTSEDGIASRRATLPSVSHAKPLVGAWSVPARASSSALRTRLSMTTERIALVADAFVPLRNRSPAMPVTRCPNFCSSVALVAKPIERRSMKLCRAEAASRSASSITPTTWPPDVTTGMCRSPHSSISISTVSAVRSAVTVRAGALITPPIGTSTGRPAATTRVRRSRSVNMPRRPSGSLISA